MKTIEELDYQKTPLGELVLRRRLSPSVPDEPVYEVKLGDEMLMSSSVNVSEKALATLSLRQWGEKPCDVLVGGLGLGYTAAAALNHTCVRSLVVIELLAPVIKWHTSRLVPAAGLLLDDPRCSLLQGDFFAHVASGGPGGLYDVILLDIDHSPEDWLQDRHGEFYTEEGLRGLMEHLRPCGVLGLWSTFEPSTSFLSLLDSVATGAQSHEVSFFNPHLDETVSNWIVVASKPESSTRTPR